MSSNLLEQGGKPTLGQTPRGLILKSFESLLAEIGYCDKSIFTASIF